MSDATSLPTPYAAARVADKRAGVWRVAENDPDSDLYAESPDAEAVIRYMSAHS
jgi:hypothetical protein